MTALRESDPQLLREAAVAISAFPQPIDETPEEIERAEPIRDMMESGAHPKHLRLPSELASGCSVLLMI